MEIQVQCPPEACRADSRLGAGPSAVKTHSSHALRSSQSGTRPDGLPSDASTRSAQVAVTHATVVPLRRRWTWNNINLVLDIILLLAFAVKCFAAFIVRFAFPSGPGAAGWALWGLDYDAWGGIQFGGLVLLAAGILLHVMVHWSWACTMLARSLSGDHQARVDDGLQTIYGIGMLIGSLLPVGVKKRRAWVQEGLGTSTTPHARRFMGTRESSSRSAAGHAARADCFLGLAFTLVLLLAFFRRRAFSSRE